jgi:hypothetical protein
MVLFHDQFDEATTFSGSQNTNSSMSFNLRQLALMIADEDSESILSSPLRSPHQLAIRRVGLARGCGWSGRGSSTAEQGGLPK